MKRECSLAILTATILLTVVMAPAAVDWGNMSGTYVAISPSNTASADPVNIPTYYEASTNAGTDGLWYYSVWTEFDSFISYGTENSPEFIQTAAGVLDPTKTYRLFAIVSLANEGNTDWIGPQAKVSGAVDWIDVNQSNSTHFSQGSFTDLWECDLGTVSGVSDAAVDFEDATLEGVPSGPNSRIAGISYMEVPEPATMALLAIGSGLLLRHKRH